jgi:hypothetical protein
MRADGQFTVEGFTPVPLDSSADPITAVSVGVATMEKRYAGGIQGRSTTLFTSAFDHANGVGTYVAMESFEGSLGSASGTFNFAHSATTIGGTDRSSELLVIVPSSGTGALAGITGTGAMAIDGDGTHRIWFDYELST